MDGIKTPWILTFIKWRFQEKVGDLLLEYLQFIDFKIRNKRRMGKVYGEILKLIKHFPLAESRTVKIHDIEHFMQNK